jgi:hypothetical protein
MRIFIFILILSLHYQLYSQKDPVKFGKIDKAELLIKKYEIDTSASAIVLCDFGYWNTNDFMFRRVLRIKILKKEGINYASQIFFGAEKSLIRGITYNIENNEIIETKLSSNSIFRERVYENYFRLRVAMPKVIVGSVFDVEISSLGPPRRWDFQRDIPVIWSELRIPESTYISFKQKYVGSEPLFIYEPSRWVGKDMPAFKEEPFTNSSENYIAKLEIEFLSIAFTDFATDWDAVARRLEENEYFGTQLNASLFLNSISNEIEEKYKTDFEKMKAAFEEVKKIKWNENESLFTTYTLLQKAFSEQSGNSADINIILINLLRKLKINCDPVILSTRANGQINSLSPSIFKFNYVIALATVNNEKYLLDATDELLPLGTLPERCLNGDARIFLETTTQNIIIKPEKKKISIEKYELILSGGNQLKGTLSTEKKEYTAFDYRKKYRKFNSKSEFIQDLEKNNPGLIINTIEITNLDSIYLPLKEKYEIELNNQVFEANDKVLINPLIHVRMKENPLKTEDRKYPVDYASGIDEMVYVKIKIPAGYELVEIPPATIIQLPEKSAVATFQITFLNNEINVFYRFNINKEVFNTEEYPLLKEFYNQIIKKHSEPIVLKKI